MAATNDAFTWGGLMVPVQNLMTKYGIDHHPAIDMTIATIVIVFIAYFGGKKYRNQENEKPSSTISFSTTIESIIALLYSFVKNNLGEYTKSAFPVLGSLFIFILFNNLMGSIPGFNPPTDKFSVTIVFGIIVFLIYLVYGFVVKGPEYIKDFFGPVWYMVWLLLPIELISHFVRPFSLALRLFGNMVGDHKVVGIFFGIWPLVLPIPFMGLGIFISFIQAFVFLLLSMIYISGAVEKAH